ncbi:MAG: nuclear transport factor 2 family protein [Parvularculaceae bacterium]|nr:nuclear transport factor 2 family protein [Parvularculaceae bacterium]
MKFSRSSAPGAMLCGGSRKWPFALCAAAGVFLSAGAQASDPPRWTAEQQEIIALLENGPMGIETDFEAWENEFHKDWTVWFVGQPEARAKPGHMASVRDYIGRGAKVLSYDAQFADIAIMGDTALARFNAVEKLLNPDGSPRTVNYASTDFLVKVDGEWKIRTTTVAHLPDDEPAP